jgi:VacB/RNase II family 3'-5' exoribonuclease
VETTNGQGRDQLKAIARQAMLERGLLPDFSADAVAQANSFASAALEPDVRDLSNGQWVSIDNDDSRDLDQLSVAEQLTGDTVRVRVAIADVDALVRRGSPLDQHAAHNTTSVYTAAQIFPMLPERLSTDLTSLVEGEGRLAVVIDMVIDGAGAIAASDVYRAWVVNKAKLAYNGVAAWLDGKGPVPQPLAAVSGLQQQLRLQDRVAQSLGQVRHAHGALTLETLETSAVFEGGTLQDLIPERTNRAQELIENLMIAANEVAARWLRARGLPAIRRVLRAPEHWDRIVALAAQCGERLPASADPIALNTFLIRRRKTDPERFPDLSLSIIKLLGRGEYVLEVPGTRVEGHFGLAASDYTHSTAPNRRFPDLLTQRLIKAALLGGPAPYSTDELRDLAAHCTAQEDNAAKVERRVGKSAAALLLARRVGQLFDAIITGATDDGTWVRTLLPPIEGRVVQGFEGLAVGDRVRVRLVHTDVGRGFIDFACEKQS